MAAVYYLCNYSLTVTSYNGFFTNAYTNTLPDLKVVITMAEEDEAWDYWVIAKVLTAYNYHMLVDLYDFYGGLKSGEISLSSL